MPHRAAYEHACFHRCLALGLLGAQPFHIHRDSSPLQHRRHHTRERSPITLTRPHQWQPAPHWYFCSSRSSLWIVCLISSILLAHCSVGFVLRYIHCAQASVRLLRGCHSHLQMRASFAHILTDLQCMSLVFMLHPQQPLGLVS